MKLLIVNGDDFGASAETNAGILRCHREGILTSTSLMVAEAACAQAAAAARECPELDVGLHLVVCQGRSVLEPARLAALVDADAAFTDSPVKAGLRYFFNRGLRQKLVDECRAQIETHLQLIGYLNHINGHLNLHVHPVMIDILVDLAVEYRVPCLRIPREPVLTTMRLSRDHGARKLVEAVIFRSLSARARRMMAPRGIRSVDWLFGLHQSGNMTERYLHGLLARLPDNCAIELYFHPASDLGGPPPSATAQREVDLLTNPHLRDLLVRHDIRLTTYGKLAANGWSAPGAGLPGPVAATTGAGAVRSGAGGVR
ncbi:MAG TPA: hopanoid biosynthesis-associated protein HpnK [Candidatus Binataceae bacterium]|nr:hopanoid biosynthesis-associated protein HpnK [Candidatus Binataceae bacterium]